MEAQPHLDLGRGSPCKGDGSLKKEYSHNTGEDDLLERAFLAAVIFPGEENHAEDYLNELRSLAETAGAVVVGETLQRRPAPDTTFYMGKGKAAEIGEEAADKSATLLIVDNDLSPAQARNLERVTDLRVVERSQLIMDIFATGARTLQARKQVELAQLQYSLPRLKRLWSHLSRIRSGIGMRGPGETQLEVDRRIVRKKIGELKSELKGFGNRKRLEVESRREFFKVCLVGYTNSGKSTILNRVTDASVKSENRLFSTLDTRTRLWSIKKNLQVLLSDTVGFIRKLPHHLVASFHATLEEASKADLLLHVVDCSHPAAAQHIDEVNKVLTDLGAEKIPRILVFNKNDRITDFMDIRDLENRFAGSVSTSAVKGVGFDELAQRVSRHLLDTYTEVQVDMPSSAGKLHAFLLRVGDVVLSRFRDGRYDMTVRVPPFELGKLKELARGQDVDLQINRSEF